MNDCNKKALCLLLVLSSSIGLCFASTSTHTQELHQVNKKIKFTAFQLHQKKYHYEKLQSQLKTVELKQDNASQTHHRIQKKLSKALFALNELKKIQAQSKKKLSSQQILLNEQLRAYYVLSQQPKLKLILNQTNLQQSNQLMHYYHYINKARFTTLTQLNLSLQTIQKNTQLIHKKTKDLQQWQHQNNLSLKKLNTTYQQRQKILLNLQHTIHTQQQHLQQLELNKKHLERTLTRLEHQSSAEHSTFKLGRGRLRWPTRGKINKIYHTPIENSQLTWNGELISAPLGQAITAVAPGKVVYSDWLRGFGLLLIIDHGNGYMSLYARNQALYKKAGDKVTNHELIAQVGHSGGFKDSALYFEIRHNGHPIDPKQWCHKA